MIPVVIAAIAVGGLLTFLWARFLRGGLQHPKADFSRLPAGWSWLTILIGTTLAAATAGYLSESLLWIPAALYGGAGVVVAWIDYDADLILDKITLPLIAALVITAGAISVLAGDWMILARSLVGAVIVGGIGFLNALFGQKGLGDVMLMIASGALLGMCGWLQIFAGTFCYYMLAGVVAVVLLLVRRDRKALFPVGPYIVAGTLIAVLAMS